MNKKSPEPFGSGLYVNAGGLGDDLGKRRRYVTVERNEPVSRVFCRWWSGGRRGESHARPPRQPGSFSAATGLLCPKQTSLARLGELTVTDLGAAWRRLDDAERYDGRSFRATVDWLLHKGVTVVATIRRTELEARKCLRSDLRDPLGEALARDKNLVVERATRISSGLWAWRPTAWSTSSSPSRFLSTEMTVVRNEFERGENSPQSILRERVEATAYIWHNYGKSTIRLQRGH